MTLFIEPERKLQFISPRHFDELQFTISGYVYYPGGEAEINRITKTTAGSYTAAATTAAEIMDCTEGYGEPAGRERHLF